MGTTLRRTKDNAGIGGMSTPLDVQNTALQRIVVEVQDNIRRLQSAVDALKAETVPEVATVSPFDDSTIQRDLRNHTYTLKDHEGRISECERDIRKLKVIVAELMAWPFIVTFIGRDDFDPFHYRSAYEGYIWMATGYAPGISVTAGPIFLDAKLSYDFDETTNLPGVKLYDTSQHCFYLRVRLAADSTVDDVSIQRTSRTPGDDWANPIFGWKYTAPYDDYNVPLAFLTCDDNRYDWRLLNLQGGQAIHLLDRRDTVPVIAQITAGGPGQEYVASIYENGPGVAATRTGVVLKVPQIYATATMPAGTYVMAIRVGETYWGQPPVWL